MKNGNARLDLGCIKPQGWIKQQMNKDLTMGFVGILDSLVPELIIDDDIYGKDRLTSKYKVKNLGVAEDEVEGSLQLQWWNSETQSNWYDGLIRHAFLTNNRKYIEKSKQFVYRILNTQDDDGYLGIYESDLRFNFDFEAGELWAQSTLFRALLGYYEVTKEKIVLQAIKKAMDIIMKSYPIYKSQPMKFEQTHGLTIVDTLNNLFRITGDKKYIEYAIWLYEDFSSHKVLEEDVQINNLINKKYKFKEHGVHTYEHFRAIILASYLTDENKYKKALKGYLEKLYRCISPSGGPIGDEWIDGNFADPSSRGYEYCSMHELLHSYSLLLEMSQDMQWADKIEWILYNAGQGARNPKRSSIAYLKSDNSYAMEGVFQSEQKSRHKIQTRYKYSPVHKDAAVCCAANAGRIYPYFIQSMWMTTEKNDCLIKTIYGPNITNLILNDINTTIEEQTKYPFENKIEFSIISDKPNSFPIKFRKPSWVSSYEIKVEDAKVSETKDTIIVEKTWNSNDKIELIFNIDIKENKDLLGDSYLSYGPLVFALDIESEEKINKTFKEDGFYDTYYKSKNEIPNYFIMDDFNLANFKIIENNQDEELWKKYKIEGKLLNTKLKKYENVTFVPMGSTILRKVTFKNK